MANDTLARVLPSVSLSANSPETLTKVRIFEEVLLGVEQVDVATEHILHAGMYSRTVRLPAGVAVVGALIDIPTLVIVHGDVDVLAGDECIEFRGYAVFAGSAGRKAMFVTRSAVDMTMVSATKARTVEEAERELTGEHEQLMSRKSSKDLVLVTGE